MSSDLILGWLLGVISSLATSMVMFWLEGQRESRNEMQKRRIEDIRAANNWAVQGKTISLRGFDLLGAKLSGKDLAGADLEDANLERARLWGTNLSEANLRHVNFRNSRMKGVDFRKSILRFADFTGAEIIRGNFSQADLRNAKLRQAKKLENCIWQNIITDSTTELSIELQAEINKQLLVESDDQDSTN